MNIGEEIETVEADPLPEPGEADEWELPLEPDEEVWDEPDEPEPVPEELEPEHARL